MARRETQLRYVLSPGRPSVVFLPGVPFDELQHWSAGATLGAIHYEHTSLNHLYCTPNKLWEYPSAGVPILCTDLEEMAAIVNEFEIGFLLPRDCTARNIFKAVNSFDETALAQARANCDRFLDENNWQRFEPRLLGLYDKLAA